MKLRLPRILAADEDEDTAPATEPQPSPALARLPWPWTLAVAALAAVPRLAYVFLFTDPENPGLGVYDDVWHHWQIAYLTREIGLFAPGGPRLWDLKGLDYFWGVLHPGLMVIVFAVTGSIDIVLLRLVSVAFGVLAVVLLFHICRRYWGVEVAAAAALLASLLPTSVMNDASGMLEPMGIALCLLGIWAWESGKGLGSGIAFGLAAMSRAEAWLFGLGLVAAATAARVNSRRIPALWLGFGGVLALYMVLLQVKTGNPIYPLWWNFFANALGNWIGPASAEQTAVRPVLGLVLALSLLGLGWTLPRRPNANMLLTFGFGYLVFTAGMLGFTSFLSQWHWWTPISRRFELPYAFVAVLVAAAALHLIPLRWGNAIRPLGWVAVAALLVASQALWIPIQQAFAPTESAWQSDVGEGTQLAAWYRAPSSEGHGMAVPPDRPDITYVLARFGGVAGKHLVSEMYDPFAYQPAGSRYEDHAGALSVQYACWLGDNDVRMIAIAMGDQPRNWLVLQNPAWFVEVGTMPRTGWVVERVSAPYAGCPQRSG